MTTIIIKNDYRDVSGKKTLVLTLEQEMTMPEVTQKIAQLMYNLAAVENQLLVNPDNADFMKQKTDLENDINVYQAYKTGFADI